MAGHVRLHFGLLGPGSSWCGVPETGEAVASARSSSHLLPPPVFSIWALYIQMGTGMDVSTKRVLIQMAKRAFPRSHLTLRWARERQ